MSKNIWIFNHYAGNMYITGNGRHYFLAKYLKENQYCPTVFCSNYDHFTKKNCVDDDRSWVEKTEPGTKIPYVFLKTRAYPNNGVKRVLNMTDYYFGLLKLARKYADEHGKPDVIYASSVHPLTLIAGIRIAKHFGIKCVSEVRDLWPESIVAYSTRWTRKNPIMKLLYAGEKWIYKKSDYLIMTWAGGYDYIEDRGWQKDIPQEKVIHISNGVDLDTYTNNMQFHPYDDMDLKNGSYKNFIYTGSISKVNNLTVLVSAAEKLKELGNTEARILVYGSGDELDTLKNDVEQKALDNIIFKGRVPRECVPSVLSQGYASILHNSSTELDKYGQSQNKFFEYLAAGKPILMTYSVGHSVVKGSSCGIELDTQTPNDVAEAIMAFCNMSDNTYEEYCREAEICAKQYDYRTLCEKLIAIIEECTKLQSICGEN